jgi:hypothetical protein
MASKNRRLDEKNWSRVLYFFIFLIGNTTNAPTDDWILFSFFFPWLIGLNPLPYPKFIIYGEGDDTLSKDHQPKGRNKKKRNDAKWDKLCKTPVRCKNPHLVLTAEKFTSQLDYYNRSPRYNVIYGTQASQLPHIQIGKVFKLRARFALAF